MLICDTMILRFTRYTAEQARSARRDHSSHKLFTTEENAMLIAAIIALGAIAFGTPIIWAGRKARHPGMDDVLFR